VKELKIQFDTKEVPLPPRPPGSGRPPVRYPFELIPVNGSALFPRGVAIVRRKLREHCEQFPTESYTVRPVTRNSCRVWRFS
jgi:hypothetical protein